MISRESDAMYAFLNLREIFAAACRRELPGVGRLRG
jgi:hypothetical protein